MSPTYFLHHLDLDLELFGRNITKKLLQYPFSIPRVQIDVRCHRLIIHISYKEESTTEAQSWLLLKAKKCRRYTEVAGPRRIGAVVQEDLVITEVTK